MADSYVQGSFAFTCSNAEMALIEEAFQASCDLEADIELSAPSAEFLEAFPPVTRNDPWSGFLTIFPDPDFPNLGVEFEGRNSLERPEISTVMFYSITDFQPDALAGLIQHCCQATLRLAPITFEWACSCSKPKIGEFGGGWCLIFPDRIDFGSTSEAIRNSLNARDPEIDRLARLYGPWGEHPAYPLTDWKQEILNDDTRLSYWSWVDALIVNDGDADKPLHPAVIRRS